MATSFSQTFVDYPACDAVGAAMQATSIPLALGDTILEVINDDVRRNMLIDHNNLLKGVRMTTEGPVSSVHELIVRPSTLHAAVNQSPSIQTTTSEAEYTQQLIEENYLAVSLKVSAPYVTAGADYSRETSWKNTETTKTTLVSSHYRYPQGQIKFAEPGSGFAGEVELSPKFTATLDAALAKATLAEKREALDALFNEYGHVFRKQVLVGGRLSVNTLETYSRTENEATVKQDIKTALEGAVRDWGLGVSTGHGERETTITTRQNREITVRYRAWGGDSTKLDDVKAWIPSTTDSNLWRVIEVTEAVSVVDLLPEPKRSVVKRLMIPLLGEWVPVEPVPFTESFPVKIYQPKNPIPSGWFWLGHSADGSRALIVKPTLPRKNGRNYALANAKPGTGASNQPWPALSRYALLSTYFSGFSSSSHLGGTLAALRPGLFLEGNRKYVGDNANTMCYITVPKQHEGVEDECLDLKSVIQLKLPGRPVDNPPKPLWAIRKNVILFDSGEK